MDMIKVPNLKAKTASAQDKDCWGCQDTHSDVMVSFGGLVPYGGDNRPSGTIEEMRVVDVFLSRKAAEGLRDDLIRALKR